MTSLSVAVAGGTACQSAPAPRPEVAAAPAPAAAPAAGEDEGDDDDTPALPRSLDEAAARFEFVCPVPEYRFDTPARVEAGGEVIVIDGDVARRETAGAGAGAVIGIVSAVKDASEATQANMKRAAALFKARGVQLVLANGDLGEDTSLENVFTMLGETFEQPVLMHEGNMEWTSAFARAWEAARKTHPNLVNASWLSEIDLGGDLVLLVLPGYHQLQFLRAGACRYTDLYLSRLRTRAAELTASGKTVVITSHGPPHGDGPRALDVIFDDGGNVGDERLTELIQETGIRYGLFGHILEAGGRACADPACQTPVRLPVKQPAATLFVNAGTASGLGWEMLDKTRTDGMAMVVKLSDKGATAELLDLHKTR